MEDRDGRGQPNKYYAAKRKAILERSRKKRAGAAKRRLERFHAKHPELRGRELLTVSAAARECGLPPRALQKYVEKACIARGAVRRSGGSDVVYFDADGLRAACGRLLEERGMDGIYPRRACARCGGLDSGNDARGGLCLDCFSHDYCKEMDRKLRARVRAILENAEKEGRLDTPLDDGDDSDGRDAMLADIDDGEFYRTME